MFFTIITLKCLCNEMAQMKKSDYSVDPNDGDLFEIVKSIFQCFIFLNTTDPLYKKLIEL